MENNANEAHIFWKSQDQQTEVWMKQVSGKTPEDILQELLGDMELAVLDRMAVSFKCGCSKERFARGIASIKKSDIQEMIDAGENIETCCQFCNSKYVFTPDELKEMM